MNADIEPSRSDESAKAQKEQLKQDFPEIVWRMKPSAAWSYIIIFGILAFICLAGGVTASFYFRTLWPIVAGAVFHFFFCAYIVIHNWPYRKAMLILNADGIRNTGNKQPFLFNEAKSMGCHTVKSNLTLVFHLKEPRQPKWKWLPIPVRMVTFPMRGYEAKQSEMVQAISRYFNRQLESGPNHSGSGCELTKEGREKMGARVNLGSIKGQFFENPRYLRVLGRALVVIAIIRGIMFIIQLFLDNRKSLGIH